MRTPREPQGPDLPAGTNGDAASTAEPFVRLSTLAPRERERAGARGDGTTYEERAGVLIRRALPPEGLDGASLERLWGRLDRNEPPHRSRGPGFFPRWALAAVVLLVSGGFVGAETGAWTWSRTIVRKLTGRPPLVEGEAPVLPSRVHGRKVAVARVAVAAPGLSAVPSEASPPSVEPVVVEPPVVETPGAAMPDQRPHRGSGVARVDPPAVPAPTPIVVSESSALSEESLLLGRALAHLRQERDSASALVELDRYVARFPSGVLAAEADRARVDALLMAGRLPDARTVLSTLKLGNGARDRELRLIRAELVGQKACAAALADYEFVLTDSQVGPLAARALWGRAACRARLGDEAGARSDLAGYLSRFPDGPHAAAARARLRN